MSRGGLNRGLIQQKRLKSAPNCKRLQILRMNKAQQIQQATTAIVFIKSVLYVCTNQMGSSMAEIVRVWPELPDHIKAAITIPIEKQRSPCHTVRQHHEAVSFFEFNTKCESLASLESARSPVFSL